MLEQKLRFTAASVVVAGLTLVAASNASAVMFTDDGTFATPSVWDDIYRGGANASVVATREAAGGNPGARLRVQTILDGTGNPPGNFASQVFINKNAVWTPSTDGPLMRVDLDIEALGIFGVGGCAGQGQALGISARQGGSLYRSGTVITNCPASFTTQQVANMMEADFGLLDLINPFPLDDFSMNPDFSAAGSPIEFGFYIANSGGQGTTLAYDNFKLTATAVSIPEPATLGLFAMGLAGLGIAARRRRKTAAPV